MALLSVNMKDVGLLPEGTYEAVLDKAEQGNDQKGNPFIKWEFAIVDNTDLKVFHRNYIDGKDRNYYLSKTLEAFGIQIERTEEFEFDTDELLTKQVKLEITHRTYTGQDGTEKTSLNVKNILPSEDTPF